jgi:zinc D-Ala-D-Ala carboxypeptidase
VTYDQPVRMSRSIRIRWIRVTGLLTFLAALAIAYDNGWPSSSSSTPPAVRALLPDGVLDARPQTQRRPGQPLGVADGAIPAGTSVFADDVPGIANLDPALLDAVRRAASDASASAGVRFVVDSGWRSRAYQERLLDDAIAKYGSRAEAARWVATPNRSAHVSGDAIDLGGNGTTAWLSAHGAAYGLCQIYDNEPWHYERRPEAAQSGCPARYADAAHDPRMQ